MGRLYVLEGSTLGGAFIDRHLATVPELSGLRLRAFSPYGSETGVMWHGFRRAARERVAAGGDAGDDGRRGPADLRRARRLVPPATAGARVHA